MGGTVLLVPKDHLVQLVPLALREGRGQWDQEEMQDHRVRVDTKQTLLSARVVKEHECSYTPSSNSFDCQTGNSIAA